MSEIFLSVLFGIITHQTNNVLERWQRAGTGAAWINLTRMCIGILACLPVYLIIRGNKGEDIKKDYTAYLTTFSTFGAGVAIGYFLDDVKKGR